MWLLNEGISITSQILVSFLYVFNQSIMTLVNSQLSALETWFLYGDQARFFNDEIHIDLKHSKTGTVAMASAGENMNASQFYITLRDDLDYLDGKHTVFGEVAEGFETLTRINEAYADGKGRPFKNIRIKHTYILEDPYDDPPQLPEFIPEASPEGKPKDEVDDEVRLEDDWVPMDEQLNPGELEEVIRSKEAHSRAVVLESIGDIPDAEVKPPDNVLFVCKLNPVTEVSNLLCSLMDLYRFLLYPLISTEIAFSVFLTINDFLFKLQDEDLHTIFSRFGTVSSAEIIRDHKTGDSLCYAFIEFEDKQACEQAYFKMDNALIDDRRIHVDFSQSVAKLWSQYMRKDNKGGGCFKCGSTDHIAKDCTGDATIKQSTKYILKDNNSQRGGHNARYEMVFDGDNTESPRRETKHLRHDRDDRYDKISRRENIKDHSHRSHSDQEMAGSNNRDRYANRSRGFEGNGDDKAPLERGARGSDSFAGKKDRERQMGRQRDDGFRRKDELDSRKIGSDSYTESRTSRDDRRKTDASHLDKRNDRDYRKRTEDGGRQDVKIDSGRRKRSPDVDDYKRRRNDEDCREDLKIDSRRRKQSPNDGDYKRRREDRGHDTDRRHHGDKR
ncbi:peptidyl-prolyl cis-trans isomerase CYP59-like isoform X3 [Trifolium pratense]|uniref:peptidyl-prolyl cis-trans isomerase CYP59-like isoform X3 n=1 Tax=Trifolium pratense TaxID=57577 RepID=UPI001E69116D|nr:peptidyl-prolyl cis-trans isomerase CYP59-like isoform X3 [Trifolium pratense]